MSSPKRPPGPIDAPPTKQRKCGGCGQFGHDRRNCPAVSQKVAVDTGRKRKKTKENQNAVEKPDSDPPPDPPTPPEAHEIDWDRVLYVVFDLETTGRRREQDEVIELAAVVLDPFGIQIEDASFSQFVRPLRPIPPLITNLTSITNDMVSLADTFPVVADSFFTFLKEIADDRPGISDIFLVGHNAKVFDIPWLVHQLKVHNLLHLLLGDGRFRFGLDTLKIAKTAIRNDRNVGTPSAYNLPTLYQFVTGKLPDTSHRAMADVNATATIFRFFFEARQECHFFYTEGGEPFRPLSIRQVVANDSDESGSDDESDSEKDAVVGANIDLEEENEEEPTYDSLLPFFDFTHQNRGDTRNVPLGDQWEQNCDYTPSDPQPMARFEEYQTATAREKRNKTGLQVSPGLVNTPIRAWRQVFQTHLLEKIVKYTNEYGLVHSKRWIPINRKDLELFFSVLFISGIQKRKDKPSNWFSENKLLESSQIKKVMSGRKFFDLLRYLHCCPLQTQDSSADDYDPSYKIKEVKEYLEGRYDRLFSPGQQLSLDETLIRAFGRIKFKVRIVTKAARYGIKIYVITDAVTAFVLRVLVYTGKSTYHDDSESAQEKLKTVQVVMRLVEPFVGSHRTIYVDRFYTSVDLLKALAEKDLYLTGTMLANRIPLGIRIPKTSREFKSMKRGDAVSCKMSYKTQSGGDGQAGLVCWKDRNIVYCLSNDTSNNQFDECRRRGLGGIIPIPRPLSIANYNKYMGGVDLADMRRLHCNSTIMGQKRWWLKLFFYLLDVGTSNALVLHNEYLRIKAEETNNTYTPMNIVTFKMKLVDDLVGKTVKSLCEGGECADDLHTPVQIADDVRSLCVYCAVISRPKVRRTRYQCAKCGIPLCSIGSGKVEDDCFTMAHKNDDTLDIVKRKHVEMKKRNRKTKK
jgi:DNA polymerase III epsilon subunit-like protein